MPYLSKLPKRTSSIRLTCEAWEMLDKLSSASNPKLSVSEYLENLVRRSDLPIYDLVRQFLIDDYVLSESTIQLLAKVLIELERNRAETLALLKRLGISPNQIPDSTK